MHANAIAYYNAINSVSGYCTCVCWHTGASKSKGVGHSAGQEGQAVSCDSEGAAASPMLRQEIAILEPDASDEDPCVAAHQCLQYNGTEM